MAEAIENMESGPCSRGKKHVSTSSPAFEPTRTAPTRAACNIYWQRFRCTHSQATTADIRYEPPEGLSFWAKLRKFLTFLGPGAVISVAYVDPDNYQTAVSSGASFK